MSFTQQLYNISQNSNAFSLVINEPTIYDNSYELDYRNSAKGTRWEINRQASYA